MSRIDDVEHLSALSDALKNGVSVDPERVFEEIERQRGLGSLSEGLGIDEDAAVAAGISRLRGMITPTWVVSLVEVDAAIRRDQRSPLDRLRGSVSEYKNPTDPVAEDDWESNN